MKRSGLNNLKELYSDDEKTIFDLRDTPQSVFNHRNIGHVLDDSINFGKDYPTGSFDYDTYHILKCLKNEPNLDEIFRKTDLKTIRGESLLRQSIEENTYIKPIASENIDLKDEILKMNPSELSDILKKHGIIASGKRKKLVKIALENVTTIDFENCEYELTEKGENFLSEFKWIELYDVCLNKFEFDDYYKFFDENENKELIQMSFDYIDEHLAHAHECEDFEYVLDCMDARRYICEYADDKLEALKEIIKTYIIRVNPVYDYEKYYQLHILIEHGTPDFIYNYALELKIDDLKDLFYNVWDSMNLEKEFISKKEAYEFLNELYGDENFADLSENYINEVIL